MRTKKFENPGERPSNPQLSALSALLDKVKEYGIDRERLREENALLTQKLRFFEQGGDLEENRQAREVVISLREKIQQAILSYEPVVSGEFSSQEYELARQQIDFLERALKEKDRIADNLKKEFHERLQSLQREQERANAHIQELEKSLDTGDHLASSIKHEFHHWIAALHTQHTLAEEHISELEQTLKSRDASAHHIQEELHQRMSILEGIQKYFVQNQRLMNELIDSFQYPYPTQKRYVDEEQWIKESLDPIKSYANELDRGLQHLTTELDDLKMSQTTLDRLEKKAKASEKRARILQQTFDTENE